MITEKTEDIFIGNYKDFLKKNGYDDDMFFKHIKEPEFSQALSYFYINIVESDLYKELFGEVKEAFLKKDDKYGYYELFYEIENEEKDESHIVVANSKHLYSNEDMYGIDDEPYITDIGDFYETEPNIENNEKAMSIYNNLITANQEDNYFHTFNTVKNSKQLFELSSYKITISETNPFCYLGDYSRCIGLKYMDNTNPIFENKGSEHRAITLESPIGPLAYLHFQKDYYRKDNNTFILSSVGVIPPLRKQGIASHMYDISNKELGFNDETIIKRTSPGRIAPKEFTQSISGKVRDHKALYLNSEIAKLDFNVAKGFTELDRKTQVKELKKINNDFNEKTSKLENHYSYEESEIKQRVIKDFEERVSKKAKKRNRKQSYEFP